MNVRTLERAENGPEAVTYDTLAALCHVYGASRAKRDRLREMREQAYRVGWWDEWHDVGLVDVYADHCELESIADRIDLLSAVFFQGLVQSPEYAGFIQRAWSVDDRPDDESGDSVDDRFIQLRMERQRRCWTAPRQIRLLMDESMPRRGPLDAQLDHVLDLEGQGLLQARVLPARDPLVVPDTFAVFHTGHRKTLCTGGFVEHHIDDTTAADRAQRLFDFCWQRAEPLALSRDRLR